ncbi:hypothetical protein D9757_004726 [Collybiopsis confluens]|uniref:Uncharacterized protein n=1 Tax=Collybiopsis confluens TaxID=2823264 RepID=A0A8H5MC27_9AGAR|nr:hypothetical protein D9757_004726 [Collybiopsis confluens]
MYKNKTIKTVVNKLDNIDTQFRFFEMEVIAGEPNLVVEHVASWHESDCRFTFDFSRVYWNSRLHTEHDRIVQSLQPGEVLADVFAGVGPFAIPAAKKGCSVLANDLNPASYEYLCQNIKDNDVCRQRLVHYQHPLDLCRRFQNKAFDKPFPAYTGPKLSKTAQRKLGKQAKRGNVAEEPSPRKESSPRKAIDHFVMNLPDTAIQFLDAFRGAISTRAMQEAYAKMPMIHCHCFTRELEPDHAEKDIRQVCSSVLTLDVAADWLQRVEEKLGSPLEDEVTIRKVRSVAPGKEMYFIRCDSDNSLATTALNTVRTAVSPPESELKRWRRIFDANSKVVHGERFVNAIAPAGDLSKISKAQFAILFKVADTSKRGFVSWEDFTVFETLLKRPDADYWMAFQFFDVDNSGYIDFDEFKNVMSENIGTDAIPFDFDCDWVKLYLGKKNGTHVLGCKFSPHNEFTQLMKGLQGERLRQAFKYLDADQDGFIRAEEFKRIILEIAGHKLSDAVIDRLPTLCTLSPGQRISYSEVVAFHNVIREMDMVERIIREATAKSKDGRIDQSDFIDYASSSSRYSLFTPMEASIIFHFAGRGNGAQRLALIDFAQLLDPRWVAPHDAVKEKKAPAASALSAAAHSAYSFVQGGFAGAFGATIVYPIDLARGFILDTRSTVVGQVLYKNSIDCARKILLNEGFLGFYRGLGPQLISYNSLTTNGISKKGVAPEKAIKLTVNDLIRTRAMDPETGRIEIGWELIAGGSAGGCQVVQGEAAKAEGAVPRGAIHIIRQLGLLGLYRGASACLLRDIPFSAIYFPAYGHLKSDIFKEGYNGKQLSFLETLGAAGIAQCILTLTDVTLCSGMPAAYLTTPADREEGFRALFKGGPARVLRSSPQFAFTLLAYEQLKKLLPYPWDEKPRRMETALTSRPDEISKIRARNALKILLDVHGDFGRRAAASGDKLSLMTPKLYSRKE